MACARTTLATPSNSGGSGGSRATAGHDAGSALPRPSTAGVGPTTAGRHVDASAGTPASTSGAGAMGATAGKGAPPLFDCENLVANETPCSQPSSHCGGPCSNSWHTDYVCENGSWKYMDVVPCGPDANHAPRCKNSFSGGQLTPCCAAQKLDCSGKPDGYPGFGCTPGDGSFCSCTCESGQQLCGC